MHINHIKVKQSTHTPQLHSSDNLKWISGSKLSGFYQFF